MSKSSNKKRSKGKKVARSKKDQKVFTSLQFEALPNEVICHVFSYLKILDLLKCGQVSKRFRAISNDDQYLWPKMLNLCYKKVPVEFLQKLLDSGCKYLDLSEAVLEGILDLLTDSELKYLNLSGFGQTSYRKNSEKNPIEFYNRIVLIESCTSLQKLSLSKFQLSLKLIQITSLQNGKTLEVLDLSKCTFLEPNFLEDSRICEFDCIQQIVENCTKLKELSLSMTMLCKKPVDFLVSNLTLKIEKLDLFNMHCLTDKHVKKLVTRCNKITELNLGGVNSITKQSLSFIIENLKLTLVKLKFESSLVRFNLNDLLQLKGMENLKLLFYDMDEYWNVHRNYIDWRRLRRQLPNIQINAKTGNRIIAIPCQPGYKRQEFWEIKAEQEEMFITYL
jgi:hypothetical protein